MSESAPESETKGERPEMGVGEQWERYGRYPYLLAKVVFFGLIIAAIWWVLNQLSAVVFPLFMSVLLAYILNPSVGKLEAKGIPRSGGIVVLLLAVISFVVVFVSFLYPTMADQVEKISQRAPQAWEVLEDQTFPWVADTLGLEFPRTWTEIMETYGEEIRDAVPMVADTIGDWTAEVVTRTRVLLVSLFNLIMIPIFTFYFLRDFERGKKRVHEYIPIARREAILERLRRMDLAVGQWFRGQIQVSLILAVLYAIGLGLVYWATGHDAQSGVVIGLLTGFLNVVPYLGFAVGSLLAFIVVLIEWTGWWALIGVATAFAVIQTVESYYITPRVIGDKVGMKPVTVIIVLLIGGHAAGLLGVLLAIPVAGAVKVLLPDLVDWYRQSSIYTGTPVEPAQVGAFVPLHGELAKDEIQIVDSGGDEDRSQDAATDEKEPDEPDEPDEAEEAEEAEEAAPSPPEEGEDPENGDDTNDDEDQRRG